MSELVAKGEMGNQKDKTEQYEKAREGFADSVHTFEGDSRQSDLSLMPDHHAPHHHDKNINTLALGALGIVYGDIGTSPLYAIKECFSEHFNIAATPPNILGILSLIFWSLILIVVGKYISYVMRADNNGEGGILALLALANPRAKNTSQVVYKASFLTIMGLLGAALLAADGTITPAISVLSAIEGLGVATHLFEPYIVPITIALLVGLFLAQKKGTAGIAKIFGPTMLLWFLILALIGFPAIVAQPLVLKAINPLYAFNMLVHHGWHGYLILGSVILCITGAEALYADMGHFNRKSIARAWYMVVLPCLLVNYFGQGAVILTHGKSVLDNPFYSLVNGWMIYPLVFISAAATIIASQALISGAFSLAQQAVQLGYSPRLTIVHTSEKSRGQIYIPEVNFILMVGCLLLVLQFKSSSALAAAYGIAVIGTMSITTILMHTIAINIWHWSKLKAYSLTGGILLIDLLFLTANVPKVLDGGWFPLLIALAVFVIMTTWKKGRIILRHKLLERFVPIDKFVREIQDAKPMRVKGTAVFMTSNMRMIPMSLEHHYRHNKVLHERIVLLTVVTENIPVVPVNMRIQVISLGEGIYEVIAHYGFIQSPKIQQILTLARMLKGLDINLHDSTFYLGREILVTTGKARMSRLAKNLFSFLLRNALSATAYYNIPPHRVVEIGMQIEL